MRYVSLASARRVAVAGVVGSAFSGPVARVLGGVQYLLKGDAYLATRGIAITDCLRLELLRDTAESLEILHG